MPILWAFLSVETMIETIVWPTCFFGHNVSKKQVSQIIHYFLYIYY